MESNGSGAIRQRKKEKKKDENGSSDLLIRVIYLSKSNGYLEFCYGVYNQYESFICLYLMVKNNEIPIER
jgi:hypothetical protein